MAPYRYKTLRNGEIRLLDLSAGETSSQLSCKIVHASIDDPPLFEALSYTWGSPGDPHTILCDDEDICVTDNLKSALLRLRGPVLQRKLWIDQICINQNDVQERNEQVTLMGDIYRKAQQVLIWLGEGDEDSRLGLNYVQILLTELQPMFDNGVSEIRFSDLIKALGMPAIKSRAWDALGRIFERAWFRRLWVVQEAALAAVATMMCGGQTVPWKDMVNVCRCQVGSHDPEHEAHSSMLAIETQRERHYRGLDSPVIDILLLCSDFNCTDPRDKIFGLLGLTTDARDPILAPDYSLSVQEVYGKVTRFLMTRDKSLAVLCDVRNPKTLQGLPTWTPDWSIPSAIQKTLGSRLRGQYNAAQSTQASVQLSDDLRTLFLDGVAVDSIHTLGNVLLPLPGHDLEILPQWESMVQSAQPYPTGEDPTTVLWRTLIADSGIRGVKSDKHHRDLYDSWHNIFDRNLLVLHKSKAEWTQLLDHDTLNTRAVEFHTAMSEVCVGRRFLITRQGYVGLGPAHARENDMICIFHGGSVPFLVRQNDTISEYDLVGECFIHGLMSGEALAKDNLELRRFALR